MSHRNARILIVDDEPVVGEMLHRVLSRGKAHCEWVSSGTEAYQQICEEPYDVLISDIGMPDMSGLELLDKVVALRPECRVILITGQGSTEWAKRAIRRGAYEYIEKPFNIEELQRLVDAALRDRYDDLPEASDPDSMTSAAALPPRLIHRDVLTNLLNHRRFQEELAHLRTECRRQNRGMCLLLIDVINFRGINAKYGHAFGDFALRELARRFRSVCRDGDVLARYGGNQFAMALLDTDAAQAVDFAHRLCFIASREPVRYAEEDVTITVSIGVAESDPGFLEREDQLLKRASQALIKAKKRSMPVIAWGESSSLESSIIQADEQSLEQMSEQFEHLNQQLRKAYIESTQALIAAVEAKDPYTKRHSLNVATYAADLARHAHVEYPLIQTIETAAILHDVGKIGIPDYILTKRERLTEEEFRLIRQHPIMAVQILQGVSFLKNEIPMILHHHEWWDGTGYPEGISGESIPLGARILHLADSIEAMLSRRSYKDSYTFERVIEELHAGAGTQFDPELVQAAVRWLEVSPDVALAKV